MFSFKQDFRFWFNLIVIILIYVIALTKFNFLFLKIVDFILVKPTLISFKSIEGLIPVWLYYDLTHAEVSKTAFEIDFGILMLSKYYATFLITSFFISFLLLIIFSKYLPINFGYFSIFCIEGFVIVFLGLSLTYFIWRNFLYVPDIELKEAFQMFLYHAHLKNFEGYLDAIKSIGARAPSLISDFRKILIWLNILSLGEPYNYKELPLFIKELMDEKEYKLLLKWLKK